MKIVLISFGLWVIGTTAQAQLWNELFRQKETALQYGAEQLAALRVYAGAVQKGFAIVVDGLHTVDAIKKGDFGQHLAYITGLSKVNPQVLQFSKAVRMEFLLEQILQVERQYGQWIKEAPHLLPGEKEYGLRIYQLLGARSRELARQLEADCSDENLAMDDAARLQRIQKLYEQMADCYAFARHLEGGFRQLALQRRQGGKEEKVVQQFSLY